MFKQTAFNIRYAYQNLRRGGRWTVFAVICIAAGVAAVVALRSLGLSIGDALTGTVRESNNGDIKLIRGEDNPFTALDFGDEDNSLTFTPEQLAEIESYVRANNGDLTAYRELSGMQITAPGATTAGRPQFVSVFLIEPDEYLPIGLVVAEDPAGVPLTELLMDPTDVVISRNLADSQDIEIGQRVRVSGTSREFTVRGIVPTEEEAGLSDLIASFFGFAYMNASSAGILEQGATPNRIAISFPEMSDDEILQASRRLDGLTPRRTSVRNVVSLEEAFTTVADVISRVIVVTGLGALLIGGVGIINTMLVMVRRRTMEIATLKTFGVKGRQVAGLFVWEALILGVLGSLVGILAGFLLGGIVNSYGEAFVQQPLQWRLYPQAALYGFVLGISVTVVFGVLPVLTATKVRPAIVLRPNESHIPVVGILQSIGVMLIIVVSIGIMAGSILGGAFTQRWWGDMLVGMIGTAATLAIIGLLIVILWVLVWIVSRLPAFGIIDLKLALRNMTSRRWRTATTLLALIAGMFALSSITFVSQGVREIIQFQFSNTLGGNVLVFPVISLVGSPELSDPLVNRAVDGLDGVQSRTRSDFYGGEVVAIDGESATFEEEFTFEDDDGETQVITGGSIGILARQSNNPDISSGEIIEGRDLRPEDAGQNVIVIRQNAVGDTLTLSVGQTLSVRTDRRGAEPVEFEIIGITAENSLTPGDAFIPTSVFTERPEASFTTIQVADENLNEALLQLSSLPLVFVLDISFIDGLFQELVNQFSALPTVVGLLSLLAAAAIMANTVLLSTLERRKQIGVLKAVGLKGRRVLGILLLENTLIAVLGATIGIGMSALGTSLITTFGTGTTIPIPSNAVPLALLLVLAAVAISVVATLASAQVVTQERVTTVLRYD